MARSVKIVGGMSTKIISENPTEKKTGASHWVNKPPLKLEHRSLENSQDLGTAYKLEGREQEVRCMCGCLLLPSHFESYAAFFTSTTLSTICSCPLCFPNPEGRCSADVKERCPKKHVLESGWTSHLPPGQAISPP